jgi:hypothetical protein
MCSGRGNGQLRPLGFPIRKSPDQSLVADSPGLIAGSNVLLRLLVPRHPPCALINLATTIDARVHCAVLKIRAVPRQNPPHPQRAVPVQQKARLSPVPSGPNSVLSNTTAATRVPSPERDVLTGIAGVPPTNQRSTSMPSRDERPVHGSGHAPRRERARCSLERR